MNNKNLVILGKILVVPLILTDIALTLQSSVLPVEQKAVFQLGTIGLAAATIYMSRKNKEEKRCFKKTPEPLKD